MTETQSQKILRNIPVLLLMAILIYLTGYLRSTIFVAINAESSSVYHHDTRPEVPGFMSFIADKDYPYLLHLKWILTLAFSIIFCFLSVVCLYLGFQNRLYIKLCLFFYLVVTAVSLLIMMSGWVIPVFSYTAYNIARDVIHIAQSPFTVVFLMTIAYYHKATAQA